MTSAYYLQHFSQSPSTLATIMLVALLSLVAAALAPRRRLLVLATGLSLAVVLGTTLAPEGGWTTLRVRPDWAVAIQTALQPHWSDLVAWRLDSDGPLNVLLYVPLGFTLALLTRRPVASLILAGGLSFGIEAYQAAIGSRIGTFADVVSNGLGATIGVTLAALVLLVVRPTRVTTVRAG